MRRIRRLAVLLLPVVVVAFLVWRFFPRTEDRGPDVTPGASSGLDMDGDPLPAYALRRFGSKRLRPGSVPMALTPDGTKLVSGHVDGLVRIWDVASGKVERTIAAHTDHVERRARDLPRAVERFFEPPRSGPDTIQGLLVSPDGRSVATQSVGCARVFDLATGAPRDEWRFSADGDEILAFSPDSSRLLLGDHGLRLWRIGEGRSRPIEGTRRDDGRTPMVRVSPDGAVALLQDWPKPGAETPRLLDLATGALRECPNPGPPAWGLPSPAAAGLVAWYVWKEGRTPETRDEIRLTDAATGRLVADVEVPFPGVVEPVWSLDGSRLRMYQAHRAAEFDPRTGAVRTIAWPGRVFPLGRTASGRALAATWGGAMRVVDAATGSDVRPNDPWDAIGGFVWSPLGARLALTRGDRSVAVVRVRDGRVVFGPVALDDRPWSFVRFDEAADDDAPQGGVLEMARIADPTPPRDWRTWALVDGRPTWVVCPAGGPATLVPAGGAETPLDGAGTLVNDPEFSADGRRLASYPTRTTLAVWDTRTGRKVADLPDPGFAAQLAVSANGRFVASAARNLLVWDVDAPGPPVAIGRSEAARDVACFAVASDGRLLATGDQRGRVHLISVQTKRRVATLAGHDTAVDQLAFSADGRLLASHGEDQTVVVWDAEAALGAR